MRLRPQRSRRLQGGARVFGPALLAVGLVVPARAQEARRSDEPTLGAVGGVAFPLTPHQAGYTYPGPYLGAYSWVVRRPPFAVGWEASGIRFVNKHVEGALNKVSAAQLALMGRYLFDRSAGPWRPYALYGINLGAVHTVANEDITHVPTTQFEVGWGLVGGFGLRKRLPERYFLSVEAKIVTLPQDLERFGPDFDDPFLLVGVRAGYEFRTSPGRSSVHLERHAIGASLGASRPERRLGTTGPAFSAFHRYRIDPNDYLNVEASQARYRRRGDGSGGWDISRVNAFSLVLQHPFGAPGRPTVPYAFAGPSLQAVEHSFRRGSGQAVTDGRVTVGYVAGLGVSSSESNKNVYSLEARYRGGVAGVRAIGLWLKAGRRFST